MKIQASEKTKRLLENFPDRRPLWSELEGEPEETKILWTMWNELRVIDGVLYQDIRIAECSGSMKEGW